MRIDPHGRAWMEAEARLQLPKERDLEAGVYSGDDFVRYDLNDDLLDYLAEAFDVLEIIAPNRRRLRVDNARTVESFDIIANGCPAGRSGAALWLFCTGSGGALPGWSHVALRRFWGAVLIASAV